jgi:hypothetical protein
MQVFLCHSSGDKAAVRELWRRLRSDGHSPWLDEQELLPGQDWQLEIRKAVRTSKIVLVCLSKDSINKSGYVQKELRFALDVADEQPEGTIFLIPVRLEECEVPERLARWQWVDIFQPDGYEKLLRTLEATPKNSVELAQQNKTTRLATSSVGRSTRVPENITARRPKLEVLSWAAAIVSSIIAIAAYFAPAGTFTRTPNSKAPDLSNHTGVETPAFPASAANATRAAADSPPPSQQEPPPSVEPGRTPASSLPASATPSPTPKPLEPWLAFRYDLFWCDQAPTSAEGLATQVRQALRAAGVKDVRIKRYDDKFRSNAEAQGFAGGIYSPASIRFFGRSEESAAEVAARYLKRRLAVDFELEEVSPLSPTPGILSVFICPGFTR